MCCSLGPSIRRALRNCSVSLSPGSDLTARFYPVLFLTRTIVGLEIAQRILDSRQHMRNERSRIVDLLIVAMRLIKYAPIANPLGIAGCVVAVGPSGTGRLLRFIFRTHFAVVDAGQNVDALAAERFLGEGVCLVYNLVTFRRKHGGQRAVWIVNFDWNQSRVGPV